MNHTYSQAEQALRDILIHKAEGTAHDNIARLVGLPRPAGWVEADWVNAIHVLAFGARGHPRAVFRFLEMALMRWHRTRQIEVSAAQPARLYKGMGVAFDDTYLGRLVRIGGPVYIDSLNPDLTGTLYAVAGTGGGVGDWVDLVPVATSENAAPPATVEGQHRYARFLCFRVREAQTGPQLYAFHDEVNREVRVGTYLGTTGLYEVLLDPVQFTPCPPTYLQATGMAGKVGTFNAGTDRFSWIDGSLSFANELPVRAHSDGGILPAELSEVTTYYVKTPGLTYCSLSLTAGGVVIDLTSAGTGTMSLTPVTTVPYGGHLTPEASYESSRTRDGAPWPLYISNGRRLARLERVLEDVLAAGVRLEIKLDRY